MSGSSPKSTQFRQHGRSFTTQIDRVICACGLIGLFSVICLGQQHTEVRDAGGGRKIELIYDAAGQVAETRTVDASGKLQVKVEHEHRPGFYVPQETTTNYWPDGKSVRSVTRVEYDENANFTGEAVRLFDESGAQTGGSRVTHDPFTGIYHCFKWNPSPHSDQAVECPVTEESGKAPERAHRLSRDEAIAQLRQARQAQHEREINRGGPGLSAARSTAAGAVKEIGIILPAQLRPGERVSGSVVADVQNYDEVPGLTVVRMELPAEPGTESVTLQGWTLEVGDGPSQRPDGPIRFTVPRAKEVRLTLREAGNPARKISRSIAISRIAARKDSSGVFEATALCLKGGLCPVRGHFSGDSTKTFAVLASRPAAIIAESEEMAYVSVPHDAPEGPTDFILAEGAELIAFSLGVGELTFTPTRRELRQGETLLVHVVLSGPEKLPEEMWRPGAFLPAVEGSRSVAPGLEPPRSEEAGVVRLVIRNATPEAASFRGSKNQTFVFELTPESFRNGEFKYHFAVEAAKSNVFALQGKVFPFLAPVRGELFRIATTGADK